MWKSHQHIVGLCPPVTAGPYKRFMDQLLLLAIRHRPRFSKVLKHVKHMNSPIAFKHVSHLIEVKCMFKCFAELGF